jgi:hypothetical protein
VIVVLGVMLRVYFPLDIMRVVMALRFPLVIELQHQIALARRPVMAAIVALPVLTVVVMWH